MSNETAVLDGVDREQLAAFAGFAAENPDDVQFGLMSRAIYEGTAAHSLSQIDAYDLGGETIQRDTREFTLSFGGWKEVLDEGGWIGATDRLEPVEASLASLAACINVGISINAVAHDVEIEHLETRVRTDFDPRVLFGLEGLSSAPDVFDNLTVDIEVEGEEIDKDLIDEWARRAPVYTLVSLEQDVDVSIEHTAALATGD